MPLGLLPEIKFKKIIDEIFELVELYNFVYLLLVGRAYIARQG